MYLNNCLLVPASHVTVHNTMLGIPANMFLTAWHPAQRQVNVCQHETGEIDWGGSLTGRC